MTDGYSPKAELTPESIPPVGESYAEIPEGVAQFSTDLKTAYTGHILRFPDFNEHLNHNGKIPLESERYRRMAGVYFTEEVRDDLGEISNPHLQFSYKPFRGLGKEDSKRKVFLGDLMFLREADDGEAQLTILIAVKPFPASAFNHAVHEIGMYQYIRSLGIPTLEVLGMVAVPEGHEPKAYLITREQRGISTLDNINWASLDKAERWGRLRPVIDTMPSITICYSRAI